MGVDTDKDRDFHDGDDPEDDGPPEQWCLHITRAGNGFVCDGSDCPVPVVFEDGEDSEASPDPMAVARLLRFCLEYFGAVGTKHDALQVYVDVKPGSDYTGPTPIKN